MERLIFYIKPEVRERIRILATHKEVSMGQYIRSILDRHIAQKKDKEAQ